MRAQMTTGSFSSDREGIDPDLFCQGHELLDRGRPRVSAGTRRTLRPSFLKFFASLPAVVVLPDPCSPTIMMTVGGFGERWSFACVPPRSATSSSWTTLITCWPGVRLRQDLLADGPFLDPADEVLDDLEVDVSLEERKAHLAHGLFDVVLLENTPAPELLENRL